MSERVWTCKIGGEVPDEVWEPDGEYMAHDAPMRTMVEQQFERQFGVEPEFCFSGWGHTLSETERAVVENREPASSQNDLLSTTDAQAWAQEFVRLHGGDDGLMLSWFANAIEAGRTAGMAVSTSG